MEGIMDLIDRMKYSIENFFMNTLHIPQLAGYAGLLAWVLFFLVMLLVLFLVCKGVHAAKMFIVGSVPVKLNRTNPIKFRFLQEAGTIMIKRKYKETGKKFSHRRDYTRLDVQKEINEVCLDISSHIIVGDRWSDLFVSWYQEHGPVSRKKFPKAVADFYGYIKESIQQQAEAKPDNIK